MTRISVVVPAYNAERTLERCLQALHAQSLPAYEILVVDDGSSDATASIAERFARVLRNTRAKGAGGARNTGALAATGEVIAFTDSDCVPNPDWLANIARALEEDGVGAVAGGYAGHVGAGFVGVFADLELRMRRRKAPDYVPTAVSNNFAVRTALFREVGGFPENFAGATLEDMAASFQLSRRARIRWLRTNGVGHHFHERVWDYLRQQHRFGRDTVVVYRMLPQLASVRTHQGRLMYVETVLAALTALALPLVGPPALLGVVGLWLLNLRLLAALARTGGLVMLLKGLALIPVRDAGWAWSVVMGGVRVLAGGARTAGGESCAGASWGPPGPVPPATGFEPSRSIVPPGPTRLFAEPAAAPRPRGGHGAGS
jgi:cellulose synthase/poly-beta-1,6-N-acetylglucosamine synthase-like glycosyltransferase